MTRRIPLCLGSALLALGLSQSAFASGLSDFRAGKDVYVNALVVEFDGKTHVTAAHQLPKEAGSLTISVSAADLGLAGTSQRITLTGTQEPGSSTITWSVNQTFQPPLFVGNRNYIDSVSGKIVTKIWLGSGKAAANCERPPCRRNTTFELAPGSDITLAGHSEGNIAWTQPVRLLEMKGVGGLEQPTLAGMYIEGPTPLCSKADEKTPLTVGAWLNTAVTAGSTVIDFSSSNPSKISVPKRIGLSSGSGRLVFDAYIQPGASGRITLSASSNGVKDSRTVTLLSPEDPACQGRF
ncbi:hypothetical protein [Archangium violaceum]|uniref:Uncharacterized protein n=1 Tax=Archangium violaceum Cb vi76 TaxID=1406225 RepID=A0A084SF21_9BACT|nr:hypothetical protein [Archangium violaceum]KFA87056.1 hypothetical protein Q664_50165 [Archangium violaceum Cb vi76]